MSLCIHLGMRQQGQSSSLIYRWSERIITSQASFSIKWIHWLLTSHPDTLQTIAANPIRVEDWSLTLDKVCGQTDIIGINGRRSEYVYKYLHIQCLSWWCWLSSSMHNGKRKNIKLNYSIFKYFSEIIIAHYAVILKWQNETPPWGFMTDDSNHWCLGGT